MLTRTGPGESMQRPVPFESGIQPHGALLVLREPQLRVVHASTSAAQVLGRPLDALLAAPLHELGGTLPPALQGRLAELPADDGHQVLRGTLGEHAAGFEAALQRLGPETLLLELEPLAGGAAAAGAPADLVESLGERVAHLGGAASVAALAEQVAQAVREVAGFARVLVHEFAAAGQGPGRVIAEAGAAGASGGPGRAPLLGQPLPAPLSEPDALSLAAWQRRRVRLLADTEALPCELLPQLPHDAAAATAPARALLAAAPPAQLQALREVGARAAATVAVVRDGAPWAQIVALHDSPRRLGHAQRAALELLAEVMATRIAAIESYARAQVASQVRSLERRLTEATTAVGDWRAALFENPQLLLEPLGAGGALLWQDGECQGCGELPPPHQQAMLGAWLDSLGTGRGVREPWHCSSLAEQEPAFGAIADVASGLLALRLSEAPGHHLAWLRPAHPALAPATAAPWTGSDLALAGAFGQALADLIVRIDAVRLLIAESQFAQMHAAVAGSQEAVVVLGTGSPPACLANAAFHRLSGLPPGGCDSAATLAACFDDTMPMQRILGQLRAEQRAWEGELVLVQRGGERLPVLLRAEPVAGGDGRLLGIVFIVQDRSAARRVETARRRLEALLARASGQAQAPAQQRLAGAIVANASLAAMDIVGSGAAGSAPLLDEVEASTARATALLADLAALDERRN